MARSTKALKIRKGDTVEVIAGKDRASAASSSASTREQPARRRRGRQRRQAPHQGAPAGQRRRRPARQQQPQGGVIEKPAAIHVSNVALVSPASGKPTRVGYRLAEDGRKVRVSRRDDVDLDETKGK